MTEKSKKTQPKTRKHKSLCVSCDGLAKQIYGVSKDVSQWLQNIQRDPVPRHSSTFLHLQQNNFPEWIPFDADIEVYVEFDKHMTKKLLYWAAEPNPTGEIVGAEMAYNQYSNMGIVAKNKDGAYSFRLKSPAVYRADGRMWPRHLHFAKIRPNGEIDNLVNTMLAIPIEKSNIANITKIVTRPLSISNNMYIDTSKLIQIKLSNDSTVFICAAGNKIFKDDYEISPDSATKKRHLEHFKERITNTTTQLVVYCVHEKCIAAKNLIFDLTLLGYYNILYYPYGSDGFRVFSRKIDLSL